MLMPTTPTLPIMGQGNVKQVIESMWRDVLERLAQDCRQGNCPGLSEKSCEAYGNDLGSYLKFSDDNQLGVSDASVVAYRDSMKGKLSRVTINRQICAIRWAARTARRQWLTTATINPAAQAFRGELLISADAIISVEGVRGSAVKKGREVTGEELKRMFKHIQTVTDRRNAALISLMFVTGLRLSEALAVTIADISAQDGWITVLGKGNKERRIFLGKGVRENLETWLQLRGRTPGPIFCATSKGGRIAHGEYVTEHTAWVGIKRLQKLSGVRQFRPHDLRHTAITRAALEVSVPAAQQLAGHADLRTTSGYIHTRPEELVTIGNGDVPKI